MGCSRCGRRRRDGRFRRGCAAAFSVCLKRADFGLAADHDRKQLADRHVVRARRYNDLRKHTLVLRFERQRRLVRLDLAQHVARPDLVPLQPPHQSNRRKCAESSMP